MRNYLLFGILFFLLSSCGSSSKLFPKKYLGTYQGIQSPYEVKIDGESITVPKIQFELVLDYSQLWLATSNQKVTASYEVKAETKLYYALLVHLESGIIEEWQLWRKGGKLIRKSIAPKPEVIFLKE